MVVGVKWILRPGTDGETLLRKTQERRGGVKLHLALIISVGIFYIAQTLVN